VTFVAGIEKTVRENEMTKERIVDDLERNGAHLK
jgi:hypothetical protein